MNTASVHPATADLPSRGQRGRRRGNAPRSTGAPRISAQNQVPPARTFGGQLTRLQGDAPTFVPASLPPQSPSASSSTSSRPANPPQAQKPRPRQRKASLSRSIAPDIATRTHEDIAHGIYECAICTNEVSRNSKVWSCHDCWTVFHIGCIKKWSKNEGSAVQNRRVEGEPVVSKQWRCPGCNLPKDDIPSAYNCWCEKELDPKIIGGLPPHSCGQTCGRERKFPKTCPHPCDLLCHAGPCPPCTATGPKQGCFCGKEETTRRCLETNYDLGWSCGAVCGDMMPCGEHDCQRICHEGVCGACTVEVDAKCYCGNAEKKMACSDRGEEKDSWDWVGCFDCKQVCGRAYDCGTHQCEQTCHPQDQADPHCPRSPDAVSHCPCGKTSLADVNVITRRACTDPIPSCQKQCGKALSCGHACTEVCHTGDCMSCMQKVQITCRCGRNSFDIVCHQSSIEPPQCMRVCKATLNCGRHECGERCCSGERKAIERQATKRKLKSLAMTRAFDENMEAEHICTRVCGRSLKCGNHTCPDLCHKGPCNGCKEAIFDDLTCNCGRTVLQAPLPCGTRPPPCNFPCRRPTACGHPAVAHNCHPDDEDCPKCPFLTEKKCMCGKKSLKNQPCWRADALCGLVCNKTLKCGSHTCRKTCHKPGECEDAMQHCQQECGKAKKTCGHPCEQPCHAPSACKEDKPCPLKIIITCDCQRRKEEVKCNARSGLPDPPSRQTSLKCDDECARLERNRGLAAALHISDDHTDEHVPYSTETLSIYTENATWAHKQEDVLRLFAADDEEKRYRFPPMKARQRAFVHSIAEDFGFDAESVDPEPHRHVVLFKTPKFVAAPMKTLAQAARIRRAQLKVAAPVESAPERQEVKDWNGFLLTKPRFALTEEEVRVVLKAAAPTTAFEVTFLPDDQGVGLLPHVEQPLKLLNTLKPLVSVEIGEHELAASVVLAAFDTLSFQPQLLGTQPTSMASAAGGWSQVAAKGAAPARAPVLQAVGQRPVYTVLGSRLKEAREKKKENEELLRRIAKENEDAVDDWEKEVEMEEGDAAAAVESEVADVVDGDALA